MKFQVQKVGGDLIVGPLRRLRPGRCKAENGGRGVDHIVQTGELLVTVERGIGPQATSMAREKRAIRRIQGSFLVLRCRSGR